MTERLESPLVYAAGGTAPATGPSLASGVFSMLWKSRISEYIMIWERTKEVSYLSHAKRFTLEISLPSKCRQGDQHR